MRCNLACVGALLVTLACERSSQRALSAESTLISSRPDSVVLERTGCYGACPAYRLRLAGQGAVTFESRNANDNDLRMTDSLPPTAMDSLMAYARHINLSSLPDKIDKNSFYCRDYATDHPTIRVTVFDREMQRFAYYTGCYTGDGVHAASHPMLQLKAFASRMDTLTQSQRWIRPAATRS